MKGHISCISSRSLTKKLFIINISCTILLFIICFLFFIITIFYYFLLQTDIKAVTVLFKTNHVYNKDFGDPSTSRPN